MYIPPQESLKNYKEKRFICFACTLTMVADDAPKAWLLFEFKTFSLD